MKRMSQTVLVTGGAGFIGSNFVLSWMKDSPRSKAGPVVNLDLLTYAGNAANLAPLEGDERYTFVRGDICDAELVGSLLQEIPAAGHRPLCGGEPCGSLDCCA